MKITCDLCGGTLQINPGGQDATCINCGLSYTMDRLREKLIGQNIQPDPPKPVLPKQKDEIIYDVTDWEIVEKPVRSFDFQPEQFIMDNNGYGTGDLCGQVKQGGIGLGDSVYIDGDYDHPYRIYSINDDFYITCAKEGMPTELFIDIPTRQRKILKNARMVTGAPNPVANAYNYPGTVQEYFYHLLQGKFPQYEIDEDVSHDELNIPVNYMFRKNGKPVLAVFLVDSNDNKGRYQVKKATRLFAPEGVVCTHFFENYRNDMPYVIDRVRGMLG